MRESWAAVLLRLARTESGITQRELARRAGTSQAAIAAYESGKRSPSIETLTRIIRATGKDLRIRLEDADDHDEWIALYERNLPPGELERARAKDRELVAMAQRERRTVRTR